MRFICPECSKITKIELMQFGKEVECDNCHKTVKAPPDYYAPDVIIGDFQIEREIARGGMGLVFLAKQVSLDREVALKILMNSFTEDAEFIRQFVQEARAAAKLNHPNVVQAFMVGEEDGVLFFAMEYIDGKTMKQILAKEKKIDPLRAAKVVRDIAEALDFAWTEYKIVHQDIKPDNIMINSKGRAKLADLGLAKAGENALLDEDGDEVFGTPQYISPEQLYGEKTDVRSDIYSLGASFYHMVVGEFPFVGSDANEIARKHVTEELVPPNKRNPDIPEKISDIIVKMMAKDINERYQSAAELSKDLLYVIEHYDEISKKAEPEKVEKTQSDAKSPLAAAPKPILKAPPVIGLKKKEEPPKTPEQQVAAAPAVTSAQTEEAKPVLKAAPAIGLKKKEEPPKTPEVKEVTPEVKVAEPAQNAPKKGVKVVEPPKKGVKVVRKKESNNTATIIAVIVIVILLIAGGVVAYLKRDVIMSFINKNKSQNEESASEEKVVPKVPVRVTPPKEERPKVPERTYIKDLTELRDNLKHNPNKELDFLIGFDDFLQKYPTPKDLEERKLYEEVVASYVLIDERLRVQPRRDSLKKEHLQEIEVRRDIVAQKAQAEAEKKATEARLAEEARIQREKDEAQRAESAKMRQEENRIASEYIAKISPAIPQMRTLFRAACVDPAKKAELEKFVANIVYKYPLREFPIYRETAIQKDVINFGKLLIANVDKAHVMYQVFEGANNKFVGTQFYKGTMMLVKSTDFKKHIVKVEVLKNRKVINFSLERNENREVLFKKIVDNNKSLNIRELNFYYNFFFDYDESVLSNLAPNSFWKTYCTKTLK